MSHEKTIHVPSGWPMLFFVIALLGLGIYGVFFLVGLGESHPMLGWAIGGEVLLWLFWAFLTIGFFIVEPNGSKVMLCSEGTSGPSRTRVSIGPTRST